MKIGVIGLGYVGLPLAAAIQKKTDYNVVGFDLSATKMEVDVAKALESKIEKIKKKICPIDDHQCEQDLKEIELQVSSSDEILAGCNIFIICVPTPVLDDYTPDLQPVKNAVTTVSKHLKKGNYVVIESTINPSL